MRQESRGILLAEENAAAGPARDFVQEFMS